MVVVCLLASVVPGFHWPHDPYALGAFEFTARPDPMPGCEAALAASIAAHGTKLPEETIRLVTFFLRGPQAQAIRTARLYARETLALMSHLTHDYVSPSGLLRAGYTFDVDAGMASPILPDKYSDRRAPFGAMFMLDEVARHPQLVLNTLLSVDPRRYGELGAAVRRSTHWSDLGRRADDHGERLLMRWMAAETLTRVGEDDTLAPKFLSAIGFVSDRYWTQLPLDERTALSTLPEWDEWRKKLSGLLDRMRDARNDVVHAGFREIDLEGRFTEDEWLILRRVLPMVVIHLQGMAFNALALGVTTVAGMWNRFAACKLLHRQISIASELQGNVIYSLKEPRGPLDE
jgi:hypothetical protein